MYLLTAEQCISILSNQAPQGRLVGVLDISGYREPLALTKTRCEELLQVSSLALATTVDYFRIEGSRARPCMLRLSNAFLTDDPLITYVDDASVTATLDVDRFKGVVYTDLMPGTYKVTYTSGFTADEEGFFQDLPDWLQSIAKYVLILHYRMTSKVGETAANVRFLDLQQATLKEAYTRATQRFHRPRVGVDFPYRSVSNGI